MKNALMKLESMKHKIAYTILVAFLLSCVFLAIIGYVYSNAESDGFDSLHIYTKEIKEDIQLQMISDQENLQTLANLAATRYIEGKSYDSLVNSFRSIGLIKNIGLLLPDNTLLTKMGIMPADGQLSFEEEVQKGMYISGRVNDITSEGRQVIRSAVPVMAEGKAVAILYGIVDLDSLKERYANDAADKDAQLFIFERGNGNFLINTNQKELGNVSVISDREFRKGYSYKELSADLTLGNSGFTSFVSKYTGDVMYLHYAPTSIADWQIMLAMPEDIVFAEAHRTGNICLVVFVFILLIMFAYVSLIFATERKQARIISIASRIRKLLLVINQQSDNIQDALEYITDFAKGRSAFYVDTDGEDFNYILPQEKKHLLYGEDRLYFTSRILEIVRKERKKNKTNVTINKIVVNSKLRDINSEFYEFLRQHGITCVTFAGITNKSDLICILGAINQKHTGVKMLLEDIAVCFSMAIYNKKHLNKTESIAATDSLTGISNRMAYKKDVATFDERLPEQFACIYIDVNELHIINNKYGHAAGDGMLLFIANSLRETFPASCIYRMGGDEFLVFTEGFDKELVMDSIYSLNQKVEAMNYHISIGMDFRTKNTDTESLVKEAERRMYEAKAQYYQQKEMNTIERVNNTSIERISTGIREFDAVLSIMSHRYCGIYCVNMRTDIAREVLIPAYLKPFAGEQPYYFSKIFSRYIDEMADPDFHRPLSSFLKYDVLSRQLLEGYSPSITYKKINGEQFRLTVYTLSEDDVNANETMWVFERMN